MRVATGMQHACVPLLSDPTELGQSRSASRYIDLRAREPAFGRDDDDDDGKRGGTRGWRPAYVFLIWRRRPAMTARRKHLASGPHADTKRAPSTTCEWSQGTPELRKNVLSFLARILHFVRRLNGRGGRGRKSVAYLKLGRGGRGDLKIVISGRSNC